MRVETITDDITLVLGDMRKGKGLVENITAERGGVDLVLTDPPYAMQYVSNHRKFKFDQIIGDESVDPQWFWMCDVVRPDGAFYCFHKWTKQDVFKKYIQQHRNITIRNQLIWIKNNDTGGDLRRAFGEKHENIWFATGEEFYFPNKRPTTDQYAARVSGSKLLHPNQKPIQLIRNLMAYALSVNDRDAVVLDPFLGSGTTGVVAAERGHGFIGFEMDEHNFEISLRRVSDMANQLKLF